MGRYHCQNRCMFRLWHIAVHLREQWWLSFLQFRFLWLGIQTKRRKAFCSMYWALLGLYRCYTHLVRLVGLVRFLSGRQD
jgi:hypothetical protein